MQSGQPDYWYGMLPGREVLGQGQTTWEKSGGGGVDPDATLELIDYTVPAGYKLYITGGVVSNTEPGFNLLYIKVNTVEIWRVIYDTTYNLPFTGGGGYVLEAGDNIILYAHNSDPTSGFYWGALVGFLHYILS